VDIKWLFYLTTSSDGEVPLQKAQDEFNSHSGLYGEMA